MFDLKLRIEPKWMQEVICSLPVEGPAKVSSFIEITTIWVDSKVYLASLTLEP